MMRASVCSSAPRLPGSAPADVFQARRDALSYYSRFVACAEPAVACYSRTALGGARPVIEEEVRPAADSPDVGKVLAKLDRFRNMGENWNQYGARPLPDSLVDHAKRLVRGLPAMPEVFPTGRRSIHMQYESPQDDYLEFELYEDGHLEMFFMTASEDESEEGAIAEADMAALVERFVERFDG